MLPAGFKSRSQIAGFAADIAEKSPEHRSKNRQKIAMILWGADQKSQRFRVFKMQRFGTLRCERIAQSNSDIENQFLKIWG